MPPSLYWPVGKPMGNVLIGDWYRKSQQITSGTPPGQVVLVSVYYSNGNQTRTFGVQQQFHKVFPSWVLRLEGRHQYQVDVDGQDCRREPDLNDGKRHQSSSLNPESCYSENVLWTMFQHKVFEGTGPSHQAQMRSPDLQFEPYKGVLACFLAYLQITGLPA